MNTSIWNQRAWEIIQRAMGTTDKKFHQDACCFLYAATVAAPLGLTKFVAGAAMAPGENMQGWGCSLSSWDRTWAIYPSDYVDEEGTYTGHCWVMLGSSVWSKRVVDPMNGYTGSPVDSGKAIGYFPSTSLTRSVKEYYREPIRKVMKEAKRDEGWCQSVREWADAK